jgi:hypothetical protein
MFQFWLKSDNNNGDFNEGFAWVSKDWSDWVGNPSQNDAHATISGIICYCRR